VTEKKMATKKKSTTALATLNGDVTSSTLAKAGVEVKLTKSEIAEYIAEKAKKQIEDETTALENKYGGRHDFYWGNCAVANPPKRIANVAKAILGAVDEDDGTSLAVTIQFAGEDNCGRKNRWIIEIDGRTSFAYNMLDTEQIPPEFTAWAADKERYNTLQKKHAELNRKNYKVLLVESILSGSVAGTTVLADLNKMVEQMVAAPVAE
jgi:hypothetical protein